MVAALEFLTGWITPTSLFILLNLVIGTIAITTRFSPHTTSHQQQHQPLARNSSLLHRVKSIEFSFYKLPPHDANSEARTASPSFLERVRSFRVSDYLNSTNPEAEAESKEVGSDHHVPRSVSEPREHKVHEKKLKKWRSEKEVVERDEITAEVEKEVVEGNEITAEVEKRRPATTRLDKRVSFGDEGVDEKADDFINRFKQQLKLQRLDSLIRYRDMLRGKQKTQTFK